MKQEGIGTVSALQESVLHDTAAMDRFLLAVTVNVTEMFRDPAFYRAFREKVAPLLGARPHTRIWHAGCSSGEEVYSVAILPEEEGLYERCRIYATDMNEAVLRRAREGIFPLSAMRKYSENCAGAGGKGSLAEYYSACYGNVIFRPTLRRNVVFAPHNLLGSWGQQLRAEADRLRRLRQGDWRTWTVLAAAERAAPRRAGRAMRR
jgi:chemotaxis protein methyltransferase CheR